MLNAKLAALAVAISENREILDSGTFFARKLAEAKGQCNAAIVINAMTRADTESRLYHRRMQRLAHQRNN